MNDQDTLTRSQELLETTATEMQSYASDPEWSLLFGYYKIAGNDVRIARAVSVNPETEELETDIIFTIGMSIVDGKEMFEFEILQDHGEGYGTSREMHGHRKTLYECVVACNNYVYGNELSPVDLDESWDPLTVNNYE